MIYRKNIKYLSAARNKLYDEPDRTADDLYRFLDFNIIPVCSMQPEENAELIQELDNLVRYHNEALNLFT